MRSISRIKPGHLLVAAACGIVLAGYIVSVLFAFTGPDDSESLVLKTQYLEFKNIRNLANNMTEHFWIFQLADLIALVTLLWLVFSLLNPAYRLRNLRRIQRPLLALLLFITAAIILITAVPVTRVSEQLFGAEFNLFASLVPPAVATGVAWLLISPTGFARFDKTAGRPSAKQLLGTFSLGTLFGLLCGMILMSLTSDRFINFLFSLSEALDPSIEPSLVGWWLLTAGFALPMAAGLTVAVGLLPLFTPGHAGWRLRLAAARCGIIFTVALAFIFVLIKPWVDDTLHTDSKSLVAAAGLHDIKPTGYTFVRFCTGGVCAGKKTRRCGNIDTYAVPRTSSSVGMIVRSSDYPLNPAIIPRLQKFVTGNGSRSIYRKAAINAVSDIYDSLLMPEKAFESQFRFESLGILPSGPYAFWLTKHLHWLATRAPLTADNKSQLQRYLSSARYRFKGVSAETLIKALVRFGLVQQAQRAYAEYKKSLRDSDTGGSLLTPPALRSGRIHGSIKINGAAPERIRVALYKNPTAPRHYSANKIVSSTVPDKDGRFEISHLTDGTYHITLLVPSALLPAGTLIDGRNLSGRIRLDAKHPVADLGTIQLRDTRQACRPGAAGRHTVALTKKNDDKPRRR